MDYHEDTDHNELDLENPLVQSMMFTDMFRELQACDSKRVDDFWCILEDTVLEIKNPNGNNK